MTDIPLGPGGEFDRIRLVAAALGDAAGALGDDCAVLPDAPGAVVLSTDVSVEEVHFRRAWLSLEEIGWRAAAAALSDLAAVGAEAVGLLVALTVPRAAADDDLVALMRGIGAAAGSVGGRVLGGDLSTGPSWSAAVTVIGRARRPMSRAGARPGDRLWVTGSLGLARAALESWRRGDAPAPEARRRFAHPEPRIAAGRWLAAHGARAMLDLSDGLGGDARHLAAASRVALDVSLDRLPVAAAAADEAGRLGVPSVRFAAEGGEDYELLVALPPAFGDADAGAFTRETGLALTRIGAVGEGAGVRFAMAQGAVALQGFDHFR